MGKTIKVYYDAPYDLEIIDKGDWIDLRVSKEVSIDFDNFGNEQLKMIDLGLSMQIPEGYEALLAPRSSTFKNFGFIQVNSIGIIDNSYSGYDDKWKVGALFIRHRESPNKIMIKEGDRVSQFRLQLVMNASKEQKQRWLDSDGFQFMNIRSLPNYFRVKEEWKSMKEDRGGFGSTGIN